MYTQTYVSSTLYHCVSANIVNVEKMFRSLSDAVDAQKFIYVFMKRVHYFSMILTKTEMEEQTFLKILLYQI